ncbi:MAG: N-acetylmuramoyl-L-alanine amidase [Candidatus Bipolaricaulia bacterium]
MMVRQPLTEDLITTRRIRRLALVIGLMVCLAVGVGVEAELEAETLLVVIDPGHGGIDPGGQGPGGTIEKWVTLGIATAIQKLGAAEPGFRIALTREDDRYIAPPDRIQSANAQRADLYISIHANASSNPSFGGFETWVHNHPRFELSILEFLWPNYPFPESFRLARLLQQHFSERLDTRDRGIKRSLRMYIQEATMPAVLVEVGFISNPAEATKLTDPAYQRLIASAILDAVRAFFDEL